jgi:hypothetical protein
MPYELNIAYRKQSRNTSKSYTKKQWEAFVLPVLEPYDIELFWENKEIGIRTYYVHCTRQESYKLRQDLTTALRRITNDPSFGLLTHGPR